MPPVQGFNDGGLVEAMKRYNTRLSGLGDDRDRARAMALLAASGAILGGGSSNTLKNVGGGISAFAGSYGDQLRGIDSQELELLRGISNVGQEQRLTSMAEMDQKFRAEQLAAQERLAEFNARNKFAQTPIFMYDDKEQPRLAQPSSGGGYLIDGELYPGVPSGWTLTNRPVGLSVQNLGTNIGTVDTNIGPSAGTVDIVAPIDVSGKAFDESLGQNLGAAVAERRSAASDAQLSLESSEAALKLLDEGVISGFGADFRLGMGKALQQVGVRLADDEIANTEAFIATRAQEVGRIIKLFGAGTGLSDADREYATKAAAGTVAMNEESIRRIIDINNRAARNVIDSYNALAAPLAGRGSIPVEIMPGGTSTSAPAAGASPAAGTANNVPYTVEPD
jgi:hypothetical protein